MILVSACLCGINCKYDGTNNLNEEILKLVKEEKAIFICPEQLGGLPTPRVPSEVKMIDSECHVINKNGQDVTDNFQRGAEEVLKIAKNLKIKKAILKSKSPSCGCGEIYDGTFSHKLIKGNGITAKLLMENGIEVENI